MSFCKKCGNELNENAVFCSKCGFVVADVEKREVALEVNEEQQDATEQTQVVSKNKCGKKPKPFLTLGIIGVVVIVGIFGFLLYNKLSAGKKDEAEKIQTEAGDDTLFHDGLLCVLDNDGYYGYINIDGEYVIEPKFKNARDFSEGLAAVSVYYNDEEMWGYINTQGEFIIEPQFTRAYSFSEGLARIEGKDRTYGYIDSSGEYVIEPQFLDAHAFSEGLAVVQTKEEKYGFVNTEGEYAIEPQFEAASDFSEGLAKVVKEKLCGYINTKGEYVIEPQFEKASSFSEGLAVVERESLYGYINTKGEYVIEPQFGAANDFSEGLAKVVKGVESYWYIDAEGKCKTEATGWWSWHDHFAVGLALQKNDEGLFGYINVNGEYVIEPQFTSASEFYDDGYAIVYKKGEKHAIIDREGNVILEGDKYNLSFVGMGRYSNVEY